MTCGVAQGHLAREIGSSVLAPLARLVVFKKVPLKFDSRKIVREHSEEFDEVVQ